MNKKIIVTLFYMLCTISTHASGNKCLQENIANLYGHVVEKRTYQDGYTLENKTTHKKIVVCTNQNLDLYGVRAGIDTQNIHKEIQYPNGDILLEYENTVELRQPIHDYPELSIAKTFCKLTGKEICAITIPTYCMRRKNLNTWIYEHDEKA